MAARARPPIATAGLEGFAGCSLCFSPFDDSRLAVAAAANFGIVGNGAQHVFEIRPGPAGAPPALVPRHRMLTNDGVYDCAWSELDEHQLISACGDGSLKLWDLRLVESHGPRPLEVVHAHEADAHGVDWSSLRKDTLASCAWDGAAKAWTVSNAGIAHVCTFAPAPSAGGAPGTPCAYDVRWSPHVPGVLACASGDGAAHVWSLEQRAPVGVLAPHDGEVLTVDWHKYREGILATGSVDRCIRLWDLRQPGAPLRTMRPHTYAVRRVRFSPHDERLLLSCSYDMTAAVWDIDAPPIAPALGLFAHHTEFAVGGEWALFRPGVLATCGWDGQVALVEQGTPVPPPHG